MLELISSVAAGAVLMALWMLGVTRLASVFLLYGVQTASLGFLAIVIGINRNEPLVIVVGCAVALLKGAGIPAFLTGTADRIGCGRDATPVLAPPLPLLGGLALLSLVLLVRPFEQDLGPNALPALTLLLLGMLLMLTRRLAISQIVGFLVLENGLFVYTITQPHSMPFVVEMGVLLDVLAGTLLAGLLTFRINRSFEHIDVARLQELRG